MKKIDETIQAPVIVLISIVAVFFVSRAITHLILVEQAFPDSLFLTINGFRLHHFVYGNFLIIVAGFFAIVLDVHGHKNWLALFYGVGLGLILDEILLWLGDVGELQRNVAVVPYSPSSVVGVALLLIFVIYIRWRKS